MIGLQAVSKSYQQGGVQVHALRAASLAAAPGEMVAVMGPAGSGHEHAAHEDPATGDILIGGRRVAGMPGAVRRSSAGGSSAASARTPTCWPALPQQKT